MNDTRAGWQTGDTVWQLLNRMPSLASESMTGVLTRG
jgi:hypothetical protein